MVESSPEPEKLRVGVIGGGYIGKTVGAEFVSDPRSTVVALADIDEEAREIAGETLYVGRGSRYDDYAEMLDAEEMDAVLVGTPHTLHYEHVTAALDRDLHVLCDKPLTTDRQQARDLVERSDAADEVLMVGYQRHLNPAFVQARKRWAQGNRTPTFVTAEITQDWYSRFADTWRADPELSGGGNLYDTGSHLVDGVLWTTGLTPTAVRADMQFADDEQRVDVEALLNVEFAEGARASLSVFSQAPCVREHVHAWDDEGAIYLEGRQWEPRRLTKVESDSTDVVPYVDREREESKAEAFIDAIRTGSTPPATARDAFAVTALTEAAYEAARAGERVTVDVDV
jgi:predicted dehydrogenase